MIRIMNDPSDDKITAAYMAGLVSGAGQNTGGITQTQLNAEKGKTAAAEQGRKDAENKLATAEQARMDAEKLAMDADQAREAAESKLAGAEKLAMDADQARLAVEKELETANRSIESLKTLDEKNDALRNENSVLDAANKNLTSQVRGLNMTLEKNGEFLKNQVVKINELKGKIETLNAAAGPAASREISEQLDKIYEELGLQNRPTNRRNNKSYTDIRSDICRLVGDYVNESIFNQSVFIEPSIDGLTKYAVSCKKFIAGQQKKINDLTNRNMELRNLDVKYRFRF